MPTLPLLVGSAFNQARAAPASIWYPTLPRILNGRRCVRGWRIPYLFFMPDGLTNRRDAGP